MSVNYWVLQKEWTTSEYMDGGTLEAHVGDLPIEESLWITRSVAEGVRHGHRHGVAHLDIKPSNILLRETPQGKWNYPKVSDWGLSKKLLDQTSGTEGLSPHYAAPEQIDSDEYGTPDDYTDIYQLGAITYTLIAGQPPFSGSSADIIDAVLNSNPTAPSEINPNVPSHFDDVILKAMSHRKQSRHESVVLFRKEIDGLFNGVISGTGDFQESQSTISTATSGISKSADRATDTTESSNLLRRSLIASIGVGTIGAGALVSGNPLEDNSPNTDTGASGNPETSIESDSLELVWSGPAYTSSIYSTDSLFYQTEGAEDGWKLLGLDKETGDVRFESETLDEAYRDIHFAHANSIAVTDDTVYVGSNWAFGETEPHNARLYALNRDDGSIRFTFDTPPGGNHDKIESVAYSANGTVVFGTITNTDDADGEQRPLLIAVDSETGSELWRESLANSQTIGDIEINDGTVITHSDNIHLYNQNDGEHIDQLNLDAFHRFVVDNETLFTSDDTITAYDLSQDETVWEYSPPGGTVRPLTTTDSHVYAATDSGSIFGLTKTSGEMVWSTLVRGSIRSSLNSLVVSELTVWVSADNGDIYVLDKESGSEVMRMDSASSDFRSIAGIDDIVYVVRADGNTPIAYRFNT